MATEQLKEGNCVLPEDDHLNSTPATAPSEDDMAEVATATEMTFSEQAPEPAPEPGSWGASSGSHNDPEDIPQNLTTHKLELENYVPADCVMDYYARDKRAVKLTCIPDGSTLEDIQALCEGDPEIRMKSIGTRTSFALITYEDEDSAVDAARYLNGAHLNGKALRAVYAASRWNDPAISIFYIAHTLDVRNLPSPYRNNTAVAEMFTGGNVLEVDDGGYARIQFDSDEALVAALTELKEQNFHGLKLTFSMAVHATPLSS